MVTPPRATSAAATELQDEAPPAPAAPRAPRWSPVLSVVVPASGAVLLRQVAPVARWVNEPLHSTLETAGGLVGLLVAALLLLRRRTFAEEPDYAWVAVALTCMGILDLAHACTPQGAAFFWSRALPTLLGGAAMALVWIRPGRYARGPPRVPAAHARDGRARHADADRGDEDDARRAPAAPRRRSAERVAVERLERSAGRLEGLVSGLLDFARARTGEGIPVDLRRTALDEVVARVVDEIGAAHPASTVRCTVSGDAAGTWDPARLAQLATNLVENAVRHAPAGSAVDVTVDGTRPGEVLLCVHNGAEPIPRELLPRVFEPFQRAAAGERRGLGLGLFIVREIARAHGGQVSVTSTAEGGTSFRVRLPREPGGH